MSFSSPILSCRVHKGKIKVIESTNINFTYIVKPKELKCQCMTQHNNGPICRHLEYYLCEHLKVYSSYIKILPIKRFKEQYLKNCDYKDGKLINNACNQFLTNEYDGCCICQTSYFDKNTRYNVKELYQCPSCHELYHMKCFSKWKKDCPRCKYVHNILKQDQAKDIQWPLTSSE